MKDKPIYMEVIGISEGIRWTFTPRLIPGKMWVMDISNHYKEHTMGNILPMKEFLKVCRAFVADAENYDE